MIHSVSFRDANWREHAEKKTSSTDALPTPFVFQQVLRCFFNLGPRALEMLRAPRYLNPVLHRGPTVKISTGPLPSNPALLPPSGVQKSREARGATAWLYAPYHSLVLSSGVWWSLLLDIHCLWVTVWRHIHVCKTTLWRSSLIQHVYHSTRTLLTRCCTMCHCIELKLLSALPS